jgi:hypothetical protein
MKTFRLLFLAILAIGTIQAAEPAYPALPEVVMLSTGLVLKKAAVKKCGPELVTVGGAGWSNSIRYEAFPDDVRSLLEPFRPGGARWFPGDTSANTIDIDGQIFIQTAGASSYKFGNIDVYLFDLNLLSRFSGDTRKINLPRPIHKTTTDADGKFRLRAPKNRPYFIFAQAQRLTAGVQTTAIENFEWRVPMSAVRKGQILNLASDYRFPRSQVEIEEQP